MEHDDKPQISQWLIASTAAAKMELMADMIVAGEISPANPEKPWLLPTVSTGQIFTSGFASFSAGKAQALKTKDSLHPTQRSLYDLVEKEVAENPFTAEDRQWANLPAHRIAETLGISPGHARRLYANNPFRHVIKLIDGKKTTLIRIGHPSDLTPEDQARMMAKFWRIATGRKESPNEFGCLVGIAKDCPTCLSYDIFRTVVRNWSSFMSGVKLALNLCEQYGDEFDTDPDNFYCRFYVFPTITVIRRFVYIARDQYKMSIQGMKEEPKCQDVCIQTLKEL